MSKRWRMPAWSIRSRTHSLPLNMQSQPFHSVLPPLLLSEYTQDSEHQSFLPMAMNQAPALCSSHVTQLWHPLVWTLALFQTNFSYPSHGIHVTSFSAMSPRARDTTFNLDRNIWCIVCSVLPPVYTMIGDLRPQINTFEVLLIPDHDSFSRPVRLAGWLGVGR